MRKVNQVIQFVFFVAAILLTLSMVLDLYFGIYLLFLGIPIGFSQYFYGILDVVIFRQDSPFRRYLILSSITVGLVFFASYDGRIIPEGLRDLLIYAVSIGSVLLAFYFWFITFKKSKIEPQEHSVLDL